MEANKQEYIPPAPYEIGGLLEIVSALENTKTEDFPKKVFPGALLWITRKHADVNIDNHLIRKLEISAESLLKQKILSGEEYTETVARIEKLKDKWQV